MANSLLWLFIYDLFHQILFYFGTVGAMLILLWEKVFKRTIHLKPVLIVAGFCLFLSCFQAWVDEHRNSEQLIKDKSQIAEEREFWKGQTYAKDESLRHRDELLGENFTTLSSTQQSLAGLSNKLLDVTKPGPQRITVKEAAFNMGAESERLGKSSVSALVINTNHTVTPIHGTLTCNRPFVLFDAEFAMGPHWTTTAAKKLIGPNKVRLEIESPAWNPSIPLIFLVSSAGDLSPCDFKLD